MIKKIAIVGGDIDAWLTALLLQLNFRQSGQDVCVQLVELPPSVGSNDAYIALPTQQALHNRMGVDEGGLLKSTSGLYSLGQRFSNWSAPDSPFLHSYDTHGTTINNVNFLQYWIKARQNGLVVPLEDFSLGAAAAKQGRIVIHDGNTDGYSNASYGYNLSALKYIKLIASLALRAGVQHYPMSIDRVESNGDLIECIALGDGTLVKADLYIDASGQNEVLFKRLGGTKFNDWRHWFPCDSTILARGPALRPIPAFNQISAFQFGWLGVYPLADCSSVRCTYSSLYLDKQNALDTLTAVVGTEVVDPEFHSQGTGVHQRAWVGNCVAVGTAAVRLELLDVSSLSILQMCLFNLLEVFPADKDNMAEADIYNSHVKSYAENLRDYQLAHYALNKRYGEEMWDQCRNMELPENVEYRIRTFSYGGVVAPYEHEIFKREDWEILFTGHNLIPEHYSPLVDQMTEGEQISTFQKMLKFIAKEVSEMPSIDVYVDMNSSEPQSIF